MKKQGFRLLSMFLALFLICNVFSVSFFSVTADEPEFDSGKYANILAGKIPTAVFTARDGLSTPAWAPSVRIHGSTIPDPFGGQTYDDKDYVFNKTDIAPHVATLTDENAATSCRFQPENVDNNDDEVLIYDLGEIREVKAVELVSTFYFLDADVYVSADRGTLFNDANKIGSVKKNNNEYTTSRLQIANGDARYIAIRLNYSNAYWANWEGFNTINEIKVYAEKTIDQSMYANALAGKIPTAVFTARDGLSTPAWAPSVRIHGSTITDPFGGQTYDDKDYVFNKTDIAPHVATLTDENAATSCRFQPENVDINDDEVLIYDLGEIREVKAVELVSTFYFLDADVYVSADRGTLFNDANKIGSVKKDESAYTTSNIRTVNTDARYIAIRLNFSSAYWANWEGFNTINEIKVYAEKTIDQSMYANALAGKIPTAVYSARDGASAPAYEESTVILGSTSANEYSGQTYADIEYQSDEIKNAIEPHVATLTDENAATSCRFQPKNVDNNDDEIIIYDLGEVREIKAVELVSTFYFLDAEIYASATRGALLDDANKIGSIKKDGSAYTTSSIRTVNTDARYIAIRLNFSNAYWDIWDKGFNTLNEINVYTAPATLYAAGGFEGTKMTGCGSFNIENGVTIGSFKILEGYAITLYDGADCTGNSLIFGRDVSATELLGFGTIASVKIEAVQRYIVADANQDQEINIKDLISMKKNAAQMVDANLAMDLNNDGKVDANDLIAMKKHLLGVE